MPDPFIDSQDLTDFLGRDVSDDPGALIALDAACDTVRDVARQLFSAGTETVSIDGTGGDCLVLGQAPVRAAGTVTVNGEAVTDYVATPDGRLLRGSAGERAWGAAQSVWPAGRQNVTVTYDYGFADNDLPRSVRIVALSLAARLLVQGPGATRETVGDMQVDYAAPASELTENELRVLRRYARTRSM